MMAVTTFILLFLFSLSSTVFLVGRLVEKKKYSFPIALAAGIAWICIAFLGTGWALFFLGYLGVR